MPFSGLVLTLEDDPTALHRARAVLREDARVTLGNPQGTRLPMVYETRRAQDAEALLEALRLVPGVALVDLVWVEYEDADLGLTEEAVAP